MRAYTIICSPFYYLYNCDSNRIFKFVYFFTLISKIERERICKYFTPIFDVISQKVKEPNVLFSFWEKNLLEDKK